MLSQANLIVWCPCAMNKKFHEAMLYETKANGVVHCKLCARYCVIPEGRHGFCLVRKNEGGKLLALSYGKSTGLAVDPIEKKPFFHFKPGTSVLSFGTPGCNFRCANCQNWELSQSPRSSGVPEEALGFKETPPSEIARTAVKTLADGVAYTYSEPTIFFEYARDTVLETKKLAPEKYHVFVSNGYFTKETFEAIQKEKLLDAIRIDLKFITNDKYLETTGGTLQPVLDSIKRVHSSRRLAHPIHLEIIALIIPTLNDSADDLRELSRFVASVGADIPLHFIKFFPYHKMSNLPATPEETLLLAKKIAEKEGLQNVFIGNTALPSVEDTRCPKCNSVLVKRRGMAVLENKLQAQGGKAVCFKCGEEINIVL